MKVTSMESRQPPPQTPLPDSGTPAGARAKTVLVLLCLAVIGAGAAGALFLVRTAPQVKKRPPVKITPLVRVQAVYPQSQTIVIDAMGTGGAGPGADPQVPGGRGDRRCSS
jgi:uncharacterized iron-regulated membrane protein